MCLFQIEVDGLDEHRAAIGRSAGHDIERRDVAAFFRRCERRTVDRHRQPLRACVRRVQLVDQVNRRDEHGIVRRLDDAAGPPVDQIGHGAHRHEIAPPFEDVHQPRRVERRGDGVLLRLGEIEAPLVDGETGPAIGRQLAQDGVQIGVPAFVVQRAGEQIAQVAIHVAPAVIVVNGEKVDALADTLQHGAVPAEVVVADGNHLHGRIDGTHRRDILVEAARIRGRIGVPAHPVAENLVADLPVLHAVRHGVAVARPHGAIARRRRTVAVFDPGRGLRRRGAASLDVDRN